METVVVSGHRHLVHAGETMSAPTAYRLHFSGLNIACVMVKHLGILTRNWNISRRKMRALLVMIALDFSVAIMSQLQKRP
jgi:hypothetical protein